MANKIISFGSSDDYLNQSLSSANVQISAFDTYKDINMTSMYSGYNMPLSSNDDYQLLHIINLIDSSSILSAMHYINDDCSLNIKMMFSQYGLLIDEVDENQLNYYSEKLQDWYKDFKNQYEEKYLLWTKMSQWKVDKSVDVKAIFNSLRNIFTWNQGERILLPEFGSRLHSLLYEGITSMTEEAIIVEIRSCISEWEPRISIVSVVNASSIDDTEDNVIHIKVIFTIPALNDKNQYTYDFSYTKGS